MSMEAEAISALSALRLRVAGDEHQYIGVFCAADAVATVTNITIPTTPIPTTIIIIIRHNKRVLKHHTSTSPLHRRDAAASIAFSSNRYMDLEVKNVVRQAVRYVVDDGALEGDHFEERHR